MTSNLMVEQLKQLPPSPGVYLMRDASRDVLYVGKAANLRHRVKSYFGTRQKLSLKLQRMVPQVSDFDFFVTSSEQEALLLELNLIKQYRPRYNVRLKDDKTFPYLKIDLNNDWPAVYVTRRWEEDGGRYFGPFASARSVRQTLKVIKGLFPFRSCTKLIKGFDSRACLEYYIRDCVGPCIGAVTRAEYAEIIKQVVLFLEGKQETVVQELENKMEKAAKALNFEQAAMLRDQIKAVEQVIEGQRIAMTVKGEQDVIAFAGDKDQACVQVFFIRHDKLIGRDSFALQGTRSEDPQQIMASFIKQFYGSSPYLPPLLLLQYPVEDKTVIEKWLQSRRGGKVHIQVPQRGGKKQLVKIVAENAEQGLEQLKIKQQGPPTELKTALAEIEQELQLNRPPLRIEGYDISDIQGTAAVGSMVVFDNGRPKPSLYRRFRIKTVSGADDYAMLREVLRRRFKRSLESDVSAPTSWVIIPDFILIDGGRGQLNAALTVMRDAGVGSIPIVSLAKENEEIFVPGKTQPIVLPRSSPGLQLLQRLRDEAHRFALGYHQKIHKKETFVSALDIIPGIGPKYKRSLLNQFGSVRAIQEASADELVATGKISRSLAERIKEYL